jgi:hypothetical protein
MGYLLIIIGVFGIFLNVDNIIDRSIGYSIGFIFTGLVVTTFRSIIIIDSTSFCIYKKSRMFGLLLTNDKIIIPSNCKGLFIKQKVKQGTGYYKAVIPVSYKVKSCEMFFYSDKGIVRFLNTDLNRAIIIADMLKETLHLNYKVE